MPYLISISIGPVQEFIAAARKTRDLWAGSNLLSEVARAAAERLDNDGCKLIYPFGRTLCDRDLSVPNKILAQAADDPPPAKLASAARMAAEQFLQEALQGALQGALQKVQHNFPSIDRQTCLAQVKGFLEFYAAWWPLEGTDFAVARERVEELLAGRKALRDFRPPCSRAGIPKSSLDPSRDAVLDGRKLQGAGLDVKRGEMLDAISLIKRFGETRRFVSTARVAADPLIRAMQGVGTDHLQNLNDLAEEMSRRGQLCTRFDRKAFPQYEAFPYDTTLFFSEGREEEAEDPAAGEARKFGRVVDGFLRKHGLPDPPAYYAILAADGDGMGKMVAERAREGDQDLTRLSVTLGKFSKKARDIVEKKYCGALVYSGGDDVLAFLPLDSVLECADALRREFQQMTGGTMSIGISIAHYAANLQTAVEWARRAEREAKSSGRNALAVHLHTRTAGDECVSAVSPWDLDPVQKRWKLWLDLLETEELPSQAAYHLRALAREFGDVTDESSEQLRSALKAEAGRILRRKRAEGGSRAIGAGTVEAVVGLLSSPPGAAVTTDSLDNAVNEMIICRRIAIARRIAALGGRTCPQS